MNLSEIQKVLTESGVPRIQEAPVPHPYAFTTPYPLLVSPTDFDVRTEIAATIHDLSNLPHPPKQIIYAQDDLQESDSADQIQSIRDRIAEIFTTAGFEVLMQRQGTQRQHSNDKKWYPIHNDPKFSIKRKSWNRLRETHTLARTQIIMPPSQHFSPEFITPCQVPYTTTIAPTLNDPLTLLSTIGLAEGVKAIKGKDAEYLFRRNLRILHNAMLRCTELHRHNLIHGDIKPSQILVEPSQDTRQEENVKLADFESMAETILPEEEDMTDIVVATYPYSHQSAYGKQPLKENFTTRAHLDTFAFGMTFLQTLIGNREFTELSDTTHLFAPLSLYSFNRYLKSEHPEISKRVRELIGDMLSLKDRKAPTLEQAAQRLSEEYDLAA